MVRKFWKSVVTFLVFSIGCSQFDRPVVVKILWPNDKGGYDLVNHNLTSVSDLSKVAGEAATVRRYKADSSEANLFGRISRGFIFRDDQGVFIPANFDTLQRVTLYAHYERLMKWDEELGLKGSAVKYPRDISVGVELDELGVNADNAAYIGVLDLTVFMPYSQSDLPISTNAGIVAHEHFHSIFHSLVKRKVLGSGNIELMSCHKTGGLDFCNEDEVNRSELFKDTNSFWSNRSNRVILGGINEGLADIWGWLYSGDKDFISRSIFVRTSRKLGRASEKIPSREVLEKRLSKYSPVKDQSQYYWLGSYYSKILWEILTYESKLEGFDRVKQSKYIVEILNNLNNKISENVEEFEKNKKAKLDTKIFLQVLPDKMKNYFNVVFCNSKNRRGTFCPEGQL